MRRYAFLPAAFCMILIVLFCAEYTFPNRPKASVSNSAGKGFAVIELFTSEGCSSCPPADALIARVQRESTDKPVYILAYHVDYWNRLGWKDAFSNKSFSERQHRYAAWLKTDQVYTPQIVLNGKKEFIGSEEGTLRNAINTALMHPAAVALRLNDAKLNGREITVGYKADGIKAGETLLVAVVQARASTKVTAGENNGRTLGHVQIVRGLTTVQLGGKASGTVKVDLPNDNQADNMQLIGLVQNEANGEILAAAKIIIR